MKSRSYATMVLASSIKKQADKTLQKGRRFSILRLPSLGAVCVARRSGRRDHLGRIGRLAQGHKNEGTNSRIGRLAQGHKNEGTSSRIGRLAQG